LFLGFSLFVFFFNIFFWDCQRSGVVEPRHWPPPSPPPPLWRSTHDKFRALFYFICILFCISPSYFSFFSVLCVCCLRFSFEPAFVALGHLFQLQKKKVTFGYYLFHLTTWPSAFMCNYIGLLGFGSWIFGVSSSGVLWIFRPIRLVAFVHLDRQQTNFLLATLGGGFF